MTKQAPGREIESTVLADSVSEDQEEGDLSATTSARRRVIVERFGPFVLFAAMVGLAELSAQREWISQFVLPAPSNVVATLIAGFDPETGVYLEHLLSTLYSTMVGFLIGSAAALTVAGLLTTYRTLEALFKPFIIALQSLPKVALAPLIILWLGFDQEAKVTIVTLIVFFPVVINSLEGMRIRNRDHFELMASLGASKGEVFRYLRVPTALPYIFAGLHIGVIFALIGAVVAELVGARAGLGYILLQSQAAFNVAGVFAILLMLLVLGQVLHRTMGLIERKVTFWTEEVTRATA